MKRSILPTVAISAGLITSFVTGLGQAAWAGTLHNGWNYSIDSFNDGTQAGRVGDTSAYEFYGMAMKKTKDKVYFAVNSNLSIDGEASNGAKNGTIAFGDLFLNFGDSSSVSAENGNLYGIRFSDANDSSEYGIGLGLYSDVTGVGLMRKNNGYSNLKSHRNKVNKKYGGHASFGDLNAKTAYFNHNSGKKLNKSAYGYTNIKSGNFLGGVEMVSNLSNLGLDFGHFGARGTETIGFSVDRSVLPDTSFIAHLFAECNNDGIVLAGDLAHVPEPSAMLSLALFGLAGAGYRRFKGIKEQAS
ncbi:MAG: PEP-CTERM sorting domain-containing protein [Cyanobacteria bacterium P01_F01_bin.150]